MIRIGLEVCSLHFVIFSNFSFLVSIRIKAVTRSELDGSIAGLRRIILHTYLSKLLKIVSGEMLQISSLLASCPIYLSSCIFQS
jgi:hypothetical protein